MDYCNRCVYPIISVNNVFDDEGICSACLAAEEFDDLDPDFWRTREERFAEICEWARSKGGEYDCIVPVSGGKDSYFQASIARKYDLNTLLVTYHGNNYLPEGQRNLDRMRSAFSMDHVLFGPSIETLVKLNRLAFTKMGDMNWHAHAGIKILPMQMAVRFGVPLVLWGEITWSISGMFSPDDYVEYNKRTVLEHDCRGFTWEDMVEDSEGLSPEDVRWLRFPRDEDLARVETRGIYVGNFFRWDPNHHAERMKEQHGFEFAELPFERTYRRMSNLDDMHENGIHDYMKFVKFGYGRASDHASKDIRTGYMTRDEGIEMVRRYDHVKPRRDLERWLDYTGLVEEEFDRIADRFRDRRVWRNEDGVWVKDNIWGTPSSYGPVHSDEDRRAMT